MLYVALVICFASSILLTFIVRKFAIVIGTTDKRDYKIHQAIIPSLGGLAIFISFMAGMFIVSPSSYYTVPIMVGATIIVITGVLVEQFQLPVKWKLVGQVAAALVIVIAGGIQISFIDSSPGHSIEFGLLSIPFTLLWIIGITNTVSLINVLDGLAAGVSSIVLATISLMTFTMGNSFVAITGVLLLASTLGFLICNFSTPKIFMGDTGVLLLGFMIAVLTLTGFKNTGMTADIPIIILGIPIVDTLFTVIRHYVNKQSLSTPDTLHLHHRLLQMGFTYKQTLMINYAITILFSLAVFNFSISTLWGTVFILAVILLYTRIFQKLSI
ncbi:MraY family glycosyltransferase [Priestia abyssalis]|uniref:MraY family glycosyltransferase n=1 Tax=Priestia abyssalis TaxID=1221450 RepID=UPI0009953FC3|nr:MraY family glycosyltransferase [Priestia abyssalis]